MIRRIAGRYREVVPQLTVSIRGGPIGRGDLLPSVRWRAGEVTKRGVRAWERVLGRWW